MMNYNEFKETITAAIKKEALLLYPDADIHIHNISKNNNVTLEALALKRASHLTPTIYFDSLYKSYQNGQDISDLVAEALNSMNYKPDFNTECITKDMTWKNMKDKVFLQVIGEKKNPELKHHIPCRKKLDLLLTYRILFSMDDEGIASGQINNTLQEHFQVTEEMLYQTAISNTPKLFPVSLQNMELFMLSTLTESPTPTDTFENALEQLTPNDSWYILSNRPKFFGATVMFYPDVLDEIAQTANGNIIVLPSSIHEVLLLPCCAETMASLEKLKLTVCEINNTVVLPEEILADQVYIYNRNARTLMTVDEWTKHQNP